MLFARPGKMTAMIFFVLSKSSLPPPGQKKWHLQLKVILSVVLEKLKVAKVIPIYKKDDSALFSNYRPVSLLPCFSKILERLEFNRCIDYINHHKILNDKQFGFRPKHSFAQLVDKVTNAIEKMKQQLEYSWIYQKLLIRLITEYFFIH